MLSRPSTQITASAHLVEVSSVRISEEIATLVRDNECLADPIAAGSTRVAVTPKDDVRIVLNERVQVAIESRIEIERVLPGQSCLVI
jgi:hypothetical protein